METLFFDAKDEKYTWFKSYYVVWKLWRDWGRQRKKNMFKSYYVVWKQRSVRYETRVFPYV